MTALIARTTACALRAARLRCKWSASWPLSALPRRAPPATAAGPPTRRWAPSWVRRSAVRWAAWPSARPAASSAAPWSARWPATWSAGRSTSRSGRVWRRRRRAPSWPTPTCRRPTPSSRRRTSSRPRHGGGRQAGGAGDHPRRRQHLPADRTHGHQERPDDDRDDDLLQGLRFNRSEAGFGLIHSGTADRVLDLVGRCPAIGRVAASARGRGRMSDAS